jgi:hypothetical protein
MVRRDVKEDAHGSEADYEARAAVGHERERDSGQRSEAHDRAHVDGGLPADERRDSRRKPLPVRIAAVKRDIEARVGEDRERGDHARRADEAELLADDREDHVRRSLRKVVDLLHALAEADAEYASGAERDHRLDGLEAGALGIVPRVEEAEDALAPVRLEPDREQDDRDPDPPGRGKQAQARPRDDEHRGDHDRDGDGRA